MTTPLVSCIIPTYNRADLVRHAVDSALAQTYPNLEVIVVDDGSTDSTPDVLREYEGRARIVRQKNAGTAAARNTGIEASRGEFLAWLDSDDAWLPQKIEDQIRAATVLPDAAVYYTRCSSMDAQGLPPSPTGRIPSADPVIREDVLYMLIAESEVMPSSCLVRRSALDVTGSFDPHFQWEDWELHLRIARKFPFAYSDAPLTRYRVHKASKSQDRWLHANGMVRLRGKIEQHCRELSDTDASPAFKQACRRHRAKYAEAHYRLGRAATRRGEAEVARESFREALRMRPLTPKYVTRYLASGFLR